MIPSFGGAYRALFLCVVVGCATQAPPETPTQPDPVEVAATHQCARCHDAPGRWPSASADDSCVGCHVSILDGGYDDIYTPVVLTRWKGRVRSLVTVPSLEGSERLRSDWITTYLLAPHDLRPDLPAMMPRLALTPSEAEALGSWLGSARNTEAPPTGDLQRGLERVSSGDCLTCHTWTGSGLQEAHTPTPLAPDLRHVRDRMTAHTLRQWLDDPQRLKPDATMPAPQLGDQELEDVVTALLHAELAPPPSPGPQPTIALLDRPVGWSEVEQRVFRHVCWHCHSDPAGNEGDGGPGNTGGLGYRGAGIELGTPEGARAAASLMRDGAPVLVSALTARWSETRGEPVPGVLGMPLGLPPLPVEDIALVATWIEQGAPGP